MRILLKCPTRTRPQKVMETISKYMYLAARPDLMGVAISCDVDDASMSRNLVQEELRRIMRPAAWSKIYFSENKSKIQACNADMDKVDYEWDIVVLVSDDMIPHIRGYDEVIRNHMLSRFPDTDGILWFNDGYQADRLNTLTMMGRKMYDSFGYIYNPEYKSLFCDTELTDQCRTTHKEKCLYVNYPIIRHEHPGTGFAQNMDALYQSNQRFWSTDMYTYISRKAYPFDWSVLIPTITGREASAQRLIQSLHEKTKRICPELRMEICLEFDNREVSVGAKRQKLLQAARGKYMAFVDDDDEITDAYIEDLWQCIQGRYHVMRLRGQISPYTFTHSVDNKITEMMAVDDVFIRPPNHLNPMMTDVAKLISFKDATRGEDLEWTIQMAKHGFLRNEYTSDPSRIHYIYNLGSRTIDAGTLEYQKKTSYETMLKMVWSPAGESSQPEPSSERGRLRLGPRGFVST